MIKKISAYGLIVLILFFLVFGIVALVKETPKEITTINYTFAIKEGIGIDLDADKLNFGGGPSGATLERKLNITSSFDSYVHIESVGPSQPTVDKNDFDLTAGSSQELTFNILVPNHLPLGKYEGTIFIYLYDR